MPMFFACAKRCRNVTLVISHDPTWFVAARCNMDLSDATVGQLLIPVEDLDRAIVFYRDTLGLRFLFSAPPQMSFFQSANVRLLVGVPETNQPRQRGSMIYF